MNSTSLYRQYLKESNKILNINFRVYAHRKIRQDFRTQVNTDCSLEKLQRIRTLINMYHTRNSYLD